MKTILIAVITLFGVIDASAQGYDTLICDSSNMHRMQVYTYHGQKSLYGKPKVYQFLTNVPVTFAGAAKETFAKKSIPGVATMAISSLALIAADQSILNGVHHFSRLIEMPSADSYGNAIRFNLGKKIVDIYQPPKNLNTFLYSLGEGLPPILICAGLVIHGSTRKNYRSLSVASQIMQSNITMGIMTQLIKRTAGRESPSQSTQPGGVWRPLSFGQYAHNVPKHDAFPSGHMGTLMSTVTVLSMNYPEKKWIRPIGYTVMAIVGFAMINNNVHWAGDYPFAIGLGYVSAKATVKMNRIVTGSRWARK